MNIENKVLKQVVDQALHVLLGFAVAFPLTLWTGPLLGVFTAGLAVAGREFEQNFVQWSGRRFLSPFRVEPDEDNRDWDMALGVFLGCLGAAVGAWAGLG